MTTGLDYSAGVLTSAQIKAAGHAFVIRYCDVAPHLNSKHVRPAEYAELVAGGVTVWLVFEVQTTDMLGGAPAGAANAARALAAANWLGYQGPVFMASDMHLDGAQLQQALAYVRAAEAVLGPDRTGVYGFPELIAACWAAGLGVAYWQCGSPPNPAPGGVHVWQDNTTSGVVAGIACDINRLYMPIPAAGASTASPAASSREDEPVDIELVWSADGLSFRGVSTAEGGTGSARYKGGWVKIAVAWTPSPVQVRICALAGGVVMGAAADKTVQIPNNHAAGMPLPDGCQMATVEGRRPSTDTLVTASWIPDPR